MSLTDDDLSALLRATADQARPGPAVVSGAVARGRGLRRRRRLAVAGSVLAVAAVSFAVAVLPGADRTLLPPDGAIAVGEDVPPEFQPVNGVHELYDGKGDGDRVLLWFAADGELCQSQGDGYSCAGGNNPNDSGFDSIIGGASGKSYDGDRAWFLAEVGSGDGVEQVVAVIDGREVPAQLVLRGGPVGQFVAVAVAPKGSLLRRFIALTADGSVVDTVEVRPEVQQPIDLMSIELYDGVRPDGNGRHTVSAYFSKDRRLCLETVQDDGTNPTSCDGAGEADDDEVRVRLTIGSAEGQQFDAVRTWFLATVDQQATRVEAVLTDGTVVPAALELKEASSDLLLAVATAPRGAQLAEWRVYGTGGVLTDTTSTR